MPGRKAPNRLDYAQPVGWQTTSNTANSTSQTDIFLNPPNSDCGLVVMGISVGITTSATTTLTLLYDGVAIFSWTIGTGGIASPAQFTIPAYAFATAAYQTLTLRAAADAGRSATRMALTAMTVPMNP